MARKEEKVQQWEKKRTDARRRSEKNARGRARELRLEKKKDRAGLKRQEHEAEQWRKRSEQQSNEREDEHGEEVEAEQQGEDSKKLQPKKESKKDLINKRVRKILMAAPYSSRKESTRKKQEKKRVNLGVRAGRSEVIHETPLRRRGKRKPVHTPKQEQTWLDSKVERKEEVSPSKGSCQEKSTSPSKDTQEQQNSPSKTTMKDQPKTSSTTTSHSSSSSLLSVKIGISCS